MVNPPSHDALFLVRFLSASSRHYRKGTEASFERFDFHELLSFLDDSIICSAFAFAYFYDIFDFLMAAASRRWKLASVPCKWGWLHLVVSTIQQHGIRIDCVLLCDLAVSLLSIPNRSRRATSATHSVSVMMLFKLPGLFSLEDSKVWVIPQNAL